MKQLEEINAIKLHGNWNMIQYMKFQMEVKVGKSAIEVLEIQQQHSDSCITQCYLFIISEKWKSVNF